MERHLETVTIYRTEIIIQDNAPVHVREFADAHQTSEGYYTHEQFIRAITNAQENVYISTPLLPRDCIRYFQGENGNHFLFLELDPINRTVYYHSSEINDLPFPRLVMAVKLRERDKKYHVDEMYVVAVKEPIHEDVEVYRYPYTNVYDNYSVCRGTIQLPELLGLSQINFLIRMFYESPNTDSLYEKANSSKLSFRELTDKIKGENFPDEILISANMTLTEWMKKIIEQA
ncbi:hypothetical protein ACE41H_15280 [Paenibacillus enshidis]|uniref:Transposase n=1 Tax=Paenibacillus enshidis TaxID=1458439 RepID=A0ABV5AW61_9BACL